MEKITKIFEYSQSLESEHIPKEIVCVFLNFLPKIAINANFLYWISNFKPIRYQTFIFLWKREFSVPKKPDLPQLKCE